MRDIANIIPPLIKSSWREVRKQIKIIRNQDQILVTKFMYVIGLFFHATTLRA